MEPEVTQIERKPVRRPAGMIRSFRHRNFRIFFLGQLASLTGTWMSSVALSWLVYRLTGSEFLLGFIGFATQFPSVFLAPVGGVLVDRIPARKMLMLTQFASMIQSFALAVLTFGGWISERWIIALSFYQGIVNGLDMPARQALLPRLIEDRSDLQNAIALNSAMFNGARFVGPVVAGFIIAASSEAYCFLIDGISFCAVLLSLQLISYPEAVSSVTRKKFLAELFEGARYVWRSLPVRSMLLVVATCAFFGPTVLVLMPVIVHDVFHGGPDILGRLMGASGLGAVAGALFLASRQRLQGIGRIIAGGVIVMGFALVFAGRATQVVELYPLLSVVGAALIIVIASCNTLIQSLVPDQMRGRVMSFHAIAFFGAMPLGNLIMGALAQHMGTAFAVQLSGVCLLPAGVVFARHLPKFRSAARQMREELREKIPA